MVVTGHRNPWTVLYQRLMQNVVSSWNASLDLFFETNWWCCLNAVCGVNTNHQLTSGSNILYHQLCNSKKKKYSFIFLKSKSTNYKLYNNLPYRLKTTNTFQNQLTFTTSPLRTWCASVWACVQFIITRVYTIYRTQCNNSLRLCCVNADRQLT